jgi:hypothetical protein
MEIIDYGAAWKELRELIEYRIETIKSERGMYFTDSNLPKKEQLFNDHKTSIACRRSNENELICVLRRLDRLERIDYMKYNHLFENNVFFRNIRIGAYSVGTIKFLLEEDIKRNWPNRHKNAYDLASSIHALREFRKALNN